MHVEVVEGDDVVEDVVFGEVIVGGKGVEREVVVGEVKDVTEEDGSKENSTANDSEEAATFLGFGVKRLGVL